MIKNTTRINILISLLYKYLLEAVEDMAYLFIDTIILRAPRITNHLARSIQELYLPPMK